MQGIYTIYHNPRCRKSRETLALLQENGIIPEVIRYLDTPPSPEELKLILAKLHLPVKSIVRTQEAVYKEKYKSSNFTDEEWMRILSEEPKLIQRPIVLKGATGVIGRPPENVLKLIK
jgi:arsenate reductase